MRIKLNLVGGVIQKDPNHRWRKFGNEACTSALNSPKYVEWVYDGTADISIHHDWAITLPVDTSKSNYGLIIETNTVISKLVEEICSNLELYKSKFKCIFTYDKLLCDKYPEFFKFTIPPALSLIRNKKIYEKSKDFSVIMSTANDHPNYLYRLRCLDLIKSKDIHNKVDVYGRGRGNSGINNLSYSTTKDYLNTPELPWVFEYEGQLECGLILGLKDYRFSFAFDNNYYRTLFSNKLTECFSTGTIPIWYGCPDIGDFFDIDGIILWSEDIDLEIFTESFYKSKMKSIKNNFNIISNFLSQEDYIYLNYLK